MRRRNSGYPGVFVPLANIFSHWFLILHDLCRVYVFTDFRMTTRVSGSLPDSTHQVTTQERAVNLNVEKAQVATMDFPKSKLGRPDENFHTVTFTKKYVVLE